MCVCASICHRRLGGCGLLRVPACVLRKDHTNWGCQLLGALLRKVHRIERLRFVTISGSCGVEKSRKTGATTHRSVEHVIDGLACGMSCYPTQFLAQKMKWETVLAAFFAHLCHKSSVPVWPIAPPSSECVCECRCITDCKEQAGWHLGTLTTGCALGCGASILGFLLVKKKGGKELPARAPGPSPRRRGHGILVKSDSGADSGGVL